MAHLVVAIDVECALVAPVMHHGRNFANHPNGPHDVVGVAVGDKQVLNVLKGNACTMQLLENAIPSTGINHERATSCVQVETGVVATSAHGIASAEHGDLFHCVF